MVSRYGYIMVLAFCQGIRRGKLQGSRRGLMLAHDVFTAFKSDHLKLTETLDILPDIKVGSFTTKRT